MKIMLNDPNTVTPVHGHGQGAHRSRAVMREAQEGEASGGADSCCSCACALCVCLLAGRWPWGWCKCGLLLLFKQKIPYLAGYTRGEHATDTTRFIRLASLWLNFCILDPAVSLFGILPLLWRFSSFPSPPRSTLRRGAWKRNTGPRQGGRSVFRPHCQWGVKIRDREPANQYPALHFDVLRLVALREGGMI